MILVTGGAGVIGSRLVHGLVTAGHRVRVLTLPGDPYVSRLAGLECEIVYGSVTDAASLRGVCRGVETVFHLAAVLLHDNADVFRRVNADGTRNLVEASIEAGAQHFILCSSISVTYPWTTPYNASKREAERIVREQTAMRWTIVRPTLAYNENGGEEYRTFVDFLKRGPVGIFVGRGRARKNPVHVDDLMRGFLAIPGNPKTYGKTYPFCGGEPITLWEMGRLALAHEGIRKPFVPLPVWLCRLAARVMGATMRRAPFTAHVIAGLTQDAVPDWSEARTDLGYQPVGFRDGLARVPRPAAAPSRAGTPAARAPGAGPAMGLRRHLGVFLLFVVLVVLYSWPLMRSSVELPDNPDAHTMTWIMLAVFRNLFTHPATLLQGNAIYPLGNTLTFTEPLVLPALIAGPVFTLTSNPVVAHKIALVLLWALSGWATYAVAFWLTRRHAAGLAAALIFTLSLPRMQYAGEFQMELTFGLPLGIYTLVRFFESQRIRYLVAFLAVVWLQAISVWYVTVILGMGLLAVSLQYVALRWAGWRGRTMVATTLGVAALALALAPIAGPYLVTHRDVGFERVAKDVDVSRYADLFTYLRTRGTWFGPLGDIESGETSLFVGVVALTLAALGLLWLRPPVGRSRVERLLTAAVPVGVALVVLAAVAGPRLRLGPSVFSTAGAVGLLIALARECCEGWRRRRDGLTDRRLSERDWVGVLLVVAAFAFFLSLGPVVHVANHVRGAGFYAWLYPYVFPLHVIRTTSRFGLLADFAIALLAGYGVTWLQAHVSPRKARAVTAWVAGLLLLEYARFPLALAMVPVVPRPVDAVLRTDPDDVAVLEWPMYPRIDGDAMLRSVFHGHRVVNAWAGFVPGLTTKLSQRLALPGPPFPTPEARTALRQIYPLRYLLVRRAELSTESRPTWEALRREGPPLLRFRGMVGDVDLYELEPLPEQGTRLWRLVSYGFLREHPRLQVAVRPVDRDPALDQWVDVELNDRAVQRVPVNEDATATATLSPPFLPVMPNEIVLTYRYRYRALPPVSDARYHIGQTGTGSPRDLSIQSGGQPYGDVASIQLDGVEMTRNRRGYNLLALDPDGRVRATAFFDTFLEPAAAHELAAWVGGLAPGTIVAGAAKDEASGRLTAEGVAALRDLGVSGDLRGRFRESHAFVGVKGAPPGTALEALGPRPATLTVGRPDRWHGVVLTGFRLTSN